jgi:hypothetical protein
MDFYDIWYSGLLWKSVEKIILDALHEYLSMFDFSQQHEFAKKALLCNTQYFYTVGSVS